MKKIIILVATVAIMFSSLAYSFSASADKLETVPLDLSGLWVQKDHDDTYLAAKITNDAIGVFFVMESDGMKWTYWTGTYTAPSDSLNTYEWESKKLQTGIGLLTSDEESKLFAYSDGNIKFDLTMFGGTTTISLERGEWDTTNLPVDLEKTVSTQVADMFQTLEIADSGYYLRNNEYVYYYVDLFNPNKNYAVKYPNIRIVARDANNILLGTKEQTLSIIYPNQHFVYGSQAFSVDETPTTVTFETIAPDDYNIKNANTLEPYQPFEVVNTAFRSDKIVGEIQNRSSTDYKMVVVVVLLKNASDELIGIEQTFVDKVKANSSTPFEISLLFSDNLAVDHYDVYANQW